MPPIYSLRENAPNNIESMKLNILSKKSLLPILGCIALATNSHAAVLVEFEQTGDDVTATWSGSLDLSGLWLEDFSSAATSLADPTDLVNVEAGGVEYYLGAPTLLSGFSAIMTSATGGTFGLSGNFFYDGGVNDDFEPSDHNYDFSGGGFTMTFEDSSIESIGADNFNNTLAWTANSGGSNTVSYTTVSAAAVPEPSSSGLLVGAGCLGLLRRRRKNSKSN